MSFVGVAHVISVVRQPEVITRVSGSEVLTGTSKNVTGVLALRVPPLVFNENFSFSTVETL